MMETQNAGKESISAKERFLYFVVIPFLFTGMLLGVFYFLLQAGKADSFSSAVLHAGSNALSAGKSALIKMMPKKSEPPVSSQGAAANTAAGANSPDATNPSAASSGAASSGTPTTGPAEAAAATKDPNNDSAAFKKNASDEAAAFIKMSPSQAGNLLSNLSLKDQVMVMLGMTQTQRAALLDKMQAKDAAKLFEALQTIPVDITDDNLPQAKAQLNKLDAAQKPIDTLVKTFNQLPAASAAALITELVKSDLKTAVQAVKLMDDSPRSQLLSVLSSGKTGSDQLNAAITLTRELAR